MTLNKTISEAQEINKEKTITFPNGIPGFQGCNEFRLSMKQDDDGTMVYWLESIDNTAVTFSLVDPVAFGLNYQLTLSDEEMKLLQADNAENIAVLLMVSKNEQAESGYPLNANIQGPLIINTASRLAMQKVISKPGVTVNIND